MNFYAAIALVLHSVPEFEEFRAVADVVIIAMRKSNDIEVVALFPAQLVLQILLQVEVF
jgi:hypothetical protein